MKITLEMNRAVIAGSPLWRLKYSPAYKCTLSLSPGRKLLNDKTLNEQMRVIQKGNAFILYKQTHTLTLEYLTGLHVPLLIALQMEAVVDKWLFKSFKVLFSLS